MKIRNIIIISVIYAAILAYINATTCIAPELGYDCIVLQNFMYPFDFIIRNINYIIFGFLFWPILIYLLIKIKNKLATFVILISIYLFVIISTLLNLSLRSETIFSSNNLNMGLSGELIGIILFIFGQVGIFYVLHLKREGRLH